MNESQLGCASLTIRSKKTRARNLVVKKHPVLVISHEMLSKFFGYLGTLRKNFGDYFEILEWIFRDHET